MRLYTVSFIGQKYMDDYYRTESILYSTIKDILEKYEYVEFIVGNDGQFDHLAADVVRKVKKETEATNASLILLLPYKTKQLKEDKQMLLKYYDEIEICSASANIHKKAAPGVRLRYMIERSDLCVFYTEDTYLKKRMSYEALRFAVKSGISVLDLYEPKEEN